MPRRPIGEQAKAIEVQILAVATKAAKDLLLRIDRNLRKTTPVLTGHAKASWIPSVGSPSSDEPDGADSSLHDAGVADVLALRLPDRSLYESTNIKYMDLLNLGRSSQAPAAFIEVAIAEAQDYVNAKYAAKGIRLDVTSSIAGDAAGNLADAYSPFGDD